MCSCVEGIWVQPIGYLMMDRPNETRGGQSPRSVNDPTFNPFSLLIPPDEPLPPELYVSLYDKLSTRWNKEADHLVANEEFRNIVKRKRDSIHQDGSSSMASALRRPSTTSPTAPAAKRLRLDAPEREALVKARPASSTDVTGTTRESTAIRPEPLKAHGATARPVALSRAKSWPLAHHSNSRRTSESSMPISSTGEATPDHPRRPSLRAEGLLKVVKSFENVLALRAELWRGLGKLGEEQQQHQQSLGRANTFAMRRRETLPPHFGRQ